MFARLNKNSEAATPEPQFGREVDLPMEKRNALVTGSTRGLGRAIAMRFARKGLRIALTYRRDEETARRTLDEIQVFSPNSILLKIDLEDELQVRSMVQEAARTLGGIDIFVANAAATAFKPLLAAKTHHLLRTFSVSVAAFVTAVQEISCVMPDSGRIVVISGGDSIRVVDGHGVLGAAKAALESMVRYLAFELGPRGITVNGINLGLIDTESSRIYLGDDFDRARAACVSHTALRRFPELDEVAAIVELVCSLEAGFLTAQTIMVDGGLSLASPLAQ